MNPIEFIKLAKPSYCGWVQINYTPLNPIQLYETRD